MRLGKVEATGSFFFMVAWLNYLDRQSIVPLAMVACLIHELCHYVTIRTLGGNVRLIRLTAIGAEMEMLRPLNYWQEGIAALAGPGANLLLALFFCNWDGGRLFSGINLVLGCFNLMPVGRLDGGRAMYCTLALLMGPDWAARAGQWMDRGFTAILMAAGLFLSARGGNVTLLLVSLWLATIYLTGKKKGIRACHAGRKQVK